MVKFELKSANVSIFQLAPSSITIDVSTDTGPSIEWGLHPQPRQKQKISDKLISLHLESQILLVKNEKRKCIFPKFLRKTKTRVTLSHFPKLSPISAYLLQYYNVYLLFSIPNCLVLCFPCIC